MSCVALPWFEGDSASSSKSASSGDTAESRLALWDMLSETWHAYLKILVLA